MPEPLTIAAVALGGLSMISGGIVESLSDKAFCSIVRDFKTRLGGLKGLPENHDVARAVRRAQIQALERLVRDYFAAGRPEWTSEPHTRPDIFRDKALHFCSQAIGRFGARAPEPNLEVGENLVATIDGILAPPATDGPADRRANEVADLAEDAVLDELRDVLGDVRLPDGFEDHFRHGSNQGYQPFLTLFGAYVSEEIKENDRFRNILTVGKLAGIEALSFDTAELVRRLDEKFGAVLDEVRTTVTETRAHVTALRADVAELLRRVSQDESVPLETLRTILAEMGVTVHGAGPAEITERLTEKAREFTALTEKLNSLTNEDPEIERHHAAATEALKAGDFARADAELAAAEAKAMTSLEAREQAAREERLSTAEVRAKRAAVAMLRDNPIGYAEAAAHFTEAAAIARSADAAVADHYEAEATAAENLRHAARIKALVILRRRAKKGR